MFVGKFTLHPQQRGPIIVHLRAASGETLLAGHRGATGDESPCACCAVKETASCGALLGEYGRRLARTLYIDHQHTVPPRKIFYSAGDTCEDVSILCEGWAVRLNRLADGRRQILSFLIPGDLFSATAPFQESFNFHVQAITQVRFGLIKRAVIKSKLDDAGALQTLASICIAERNEADQLLTDLGQRTAVARISRLILYLMERLNARDMVRDLTFSFPLRQQHIADAVGLTTVHVNRVVSTFRKSGLIEIEGGQLRILNLKELQQVGEMR